MLHESSGVILGPINKNAKLDPGSESIATGVLADYGSCDLDSSNIHHNGTGSRGKIGHGGRPHAWLSLPVGTKEGFSDARGDLNQDSSDVAVRTAEGQSFSAGGHVLSPASIREDPPQRQLSCEVPSGAVLGESANGDATLCPSTHANEEEEEEETLQEQWAAQRNDTVHRAVISLKMSAGAPETSLPTPTMLRLSNVMRDSMIGVPRVTIKTPRGKHVDVFSGRAAVDWMHRQQRAVALQVLQQLLNARLVSVVSDEMPALAAFQAVDDDVQHYRLTTDAALHVEPGRPLNGQYWWYGGGRQAPWVAHSLHQRILALFEKHRSGEVIHESVKGDPLFWEWARDTAELQKVSLAQASRTQLLATFANIYNIMFMHSLVMFGPGPLGGSASKRRSFLADFTYIVDERCFSLGDIEHGILRGNQPQHAPTLSRLLSFQPKRPFGKDDGRLHLVVQPLEPSIHFGLVRDPHSCTSMPTYTPELVERQLTSAAILWLTETVVVDADTASVTLPKVFKHYGRDFGGNEMERLLWVLQHMMAQPEGDLRLLLERQAAIQDTVGYSLDLKVRYSDAPTEQREDRGASESRRESVTAGGSDGSSVQSQLPPPPPPMLLQPSSDKLSKQPLIQVSKSAPHSRTPSGTRLLRLGTAL